MDMNQPAPHNALDDAPQGLIGQPLDRVDGRLKVCGQAPYAYEVQEFGRPLYGFVVEAQVALGTLRGLDTTAAEKAPGVVHVMTYRNVPRQAPFDTKGEDRFARARPQLADDQVHHFGDPIAFVVAESFECARAAALLVRVDYATERGAYDMARHLGDAVKPPDQGEKKSDTAVGDFDGAFARAGTQVDSRFSTPTQIHAQMEPHAALASWKGDQVTVHCSAQLPNSAIKCLASTLQIPVEQARIVTRYIGGGFGGKLPIYGDVILAALASRELRRPVKITFTRQQMFHVTTHRSETLQRVRLGAGPDGKLVAIGHDSIAHSQRRDDFYESAAAQTRTLYAAPNRSTTQRRVPLDMPFADSMRAPGEAVGLLALEVAMDELAAALKMDPIALRVANEPSEDPEKHIPYSTRQLVQCMNEGARQFGWDQRKPLPRAMVEGRKWIGIGMAAATRGNNLRPSKCRVKIDHAGVLTVQMAMTDIGTGSYTVLTQIAGEMMGLPMERIRMQLGDTAFPETAGSGGSFGAASSGSALFDACQNLRAALAQKAGFDPSSAVFKDGEISDGRRSKKLGSLAGRQGIEAQGEIKPGDMAKKTSQQAYGAHFAEVSVDMDTGEVRLRRMLGVFAAGRILNAKTARSQALGGMVWGVGSALFEEAMLDPRYGFYANHDLSEYHVAAHADIPAIQAVFLPEIDADTNPLKSKGIGELGICGAGAAVGNAIYNACGVRLRDYPFTLDKILAQL
jgi:xanthine dehydrogenase YagR molybdenum-binding subunit